MGSKVYLNQKTHTPCIVSSGYNVRLRDAVSIVNHMQQFSKENTKYSILTKGADHITREVEKTEIEQYGARKL